MVCFLLANQPRQISMSLLNNTAGSNETAISTSCDGRWEGIIFWIFVTVVSFIMGFPAAVVVLCDMFQKRRKGITFTPNDVFMSNLTVMDVLFLILSLPELYNLPHGYRLGYEKFFSVLLSLSQCGRPLFITCICLDCYVAVVHPVAYRARKSLIPRVLMAAGVWTVTILFGIYYSSKHSQVSLDFELVVFFTLTLPVIGFFDFFILWTLKRSNPGGKEVHPQKKKALQTIINNLVVTFISYFPPIVLLFASQFLSLDSKRLTCLVVAPAVSITVSGNTISLMVYLNNLGKLEWLKCWRKE